MKLYVNAVAETVEVYTGNGNAIVDIDSVDDFNVGTFLGNLFFIGTVDEVAFFPDVLTPTEITAIYNGGLTREELGTVWRESTEEWLAPSALSSPGGARYHRQLVAVSDQGKIYYGDL